MVETIDYSVIIRTTGNAHEKYQRLLDSVSGLEPQPKEIIVVLPEGNELPSERLGWETFIFCPKGMVSQRMKGIDSCKTQFALICDDDVCFSSEFVTKLHDPIKEGRGFFSAAPLYSFLPEKGKNSVLAAITGSAIPTVLHRKTRYVTVLKSTGYSYNRHLKPEKSTFYETQAVAWTCFYADIDALKKLEFHKETWLDSHGYSALDDQTMFYKAWLMGMKTIVVADAEYEHLDAKTSTRNNKPSVIYSRSFNRLVFWHRFIYSRQKTILGKLTSNFAVIYRYIWIDITMIVSVLRHRMSSDDRSLSHKGLRDAREYLKSEEYHHLPPVT